MAEKKNGKFDPSKHLTKIQGRDYLEVKWRLVWFNEEHPDWAIDTRVAKFGESGWVIFAAEVKDAEGRVRATGHGFGHKKGFSRWFEKAETTAVGRALAHLGYGTQFAQELEEETELADAPVEPPTVKSSTANQPMTEAEYYDQKGKEARANREAWEGKAASQKQIKALFAIAKTKFGWDSATTESHIKAKLGIESFKEMTMGNASDFIDEWGKVTQEEATPF